MAVTLSNVKIWQSYHHEFGGPLFWNTVYIHRVQKKCANLFCLWLNCDDISRRDKSWRCKIMLRVDPRDKVNEANYRNVMLLQTVLSLALFDVSGLRAPYSSMLTILQI